MKQTQEQRLEEFFRKNVNNGFALAITGSWGVGKTFFWNTFFKQKTEAEEDIKKGFYYEASRIDYISVFENKKYAYISLFGIESIQDLKNAICTRISKNPYVSDFNNGLMFSSLLKKSLEQFKDIKVSQYGVSASAKLLENLLYAQVQDAIICFDDFERLSEKLKIQDVMGLANQLKLERNCQVILILDESKTEGNNKEKYAEYKEKLIDETIKITSVEPLIRASTKDLDEPLIDWVVKFAKDFEIHNFRFFQKVIRLYRQFLGQFPDEIAYSTKEIILIRILQGYFIEDFGKKYEFDWEDITFSGFKSDRDKWTETKQKTFKIIDSEMPFYFLKLDNWFIEFKSWFSQEKDFDDNLIQELVASELLNEKYQLARENIERLLQNYKAFDIDLMFSKNLALEIKKIIKFETLENIEFYCSILAEFNEMDHIADIDHLVKMYLQSEFSSNRTKLLEKHYWHANKNNKFRKYIKEFLDDPAYFRQDDFLKIINLFLVKGEIAYGTEEVFRHLKKEHLQRFILDEYPPNFKKASLIGIIEVILDLYNILKLENQRKIAKIWIKEILEEQGEKKGFPDHYVKYFTEKL